MTASSPLNTPSHFAGWRLPPTGKVRRTRPFLVNYYHMMSLENQIDQRSERLAQWDVLILHHWGVEHEGISLRKIRELNPGIVILAWLPIQSPGDPEMAEGVPGEGPDTWYIRHADGAYTCPPWGGHMTNPYVHNYAWPRHLIKYFEKCMATGMYDGVLYDCLGARPHPDFDIDCDGKSDTDSDRAAWAEGMNFLVGETRRKFPKAIITGNGGAPWPACCDYHKWANGCMYEYALGNQLGGSGPEWSRLWEGMTACKEAAKDRPMYFFVQVDLRMDRTVGEARRLEALTGDDLRRLRLGLTTTLLVDGAYFGFDRGDCLHGQLWWFDEYDADLGMPREEYRRNGFGPDTLSRQYDKGLVVVNVGQGPASVKLERPHQDVSTKATGKTFEIPPQDGRILLSSANE